MSENNSNKDSDSKQPSQDNGETPISNQKLVLLISGVIIILIIITSMLIPIAKGSLETSNTKQSENTNTSDDASKQATIDSYDKTNKQQVTVDSKNIGTTGLVQHPAYFMTLITNEGEPLYLKTSKETYGTYSAGETFEIWNDTSSNTILSTDDELFTHIDKND